MLIKYIENQRGKSKPKKKKGVVFILFCFKNINKMLLKT